MSARPLEFAALDEAPRRLTPTERLHEVSMAAITRRPSVSVQGLTLKQNAQGTWLCDSLQLHQREDESDASFLTRSATDWTLVVEMLEMLGGAIPEPDPAP